MLNVNGRFRSVLRPFTPRITPFYTLYLAQIQLVFRPYTFFEQLFSFAIFCLEHHILSILPADSSL